MSTPPSNYNRNLSLFGSALALILLVLYTAIIGYMLKRVLVDSGGEAITFEDGLIYIVTTVGGLISALVIGKLAVSDPTEAPVIMRMNAAGQPEKDKLSTNLAYAYLMTWVMVGFSCLVIGVVLYPDVNRTVSDIGTTWFGLAIASSYAFLGIQPTGGNGK